MCASLACKCEVGGRVKFGVYASSAGGQIVRLADGQIVRLAGGQIVMSAGAQIKGRAGGGWRRC